MPQLMPLVLKDRKATPVSHTFTPREVNNSGVGTVVESSGVPIGDSRVSLGLNVTTTGRYKPSIRLTVPVVQTATVNGISQPTVLRTGYAEVNFNFEGTSTEAERADLVGMVMDALAPTQTMVNDTLVKLQGVY